MTTTKSVFAFVRDPSHQMIPIAPQRAPTNDKTTLHHMTLWVPIKTNGWIKVKEKALEEQQKQDQNESNKETLPQMMTK